MMVLRSVKALQMNSHERRKIKKEVFKAWHISLSFLRLMDSHNLDLMQIKKKTNYNNSFKDN